MTQQQQHLPDLATVAQISDQTTIEMLKVPEDMVLHHQLLRHLHQHLRLDRGLPTVRTLMINMEQAVRGELKK